VGLAQHRSVATHKFSESRDQFTSLLTLSDSDLAARASQLAGQGVGTALIVTFRPQAVDAYPPVGLLYYPFLSTAKEPSASVFERCLGLLRPRRYDNPFPARGEA
jgi:hypothetical protein